MEKNHHVFLTESANCLLCGGKNYSEESISLIRRSFFSDGELHLKIDKNCLSDSVVVISSIQSPATNLIELLFILHEFTARGMKELFLILPYLAYNRQDRRINEGDFLNATHVLKLLLQSGATRFGFIDVHNETTLNFLKEKNIPVHVVSAVPYLVQSVRQKFGNIECVVAPDAGSVQLAEEYAMLLGCPFIILKKQRKGDGSVAREELSSGESTAIKDKNILIVDDILDTAGTIVSATDMLTYAGAKNVYVCVTHSFFSHPATEKINKSMIRGIISTDSITLDQSVINSISCPLTRISIGPCINDLLECHTPNLC